MSSGRSASEGQQQRGGGGRGRNRGRGGGGRGQRDARSAGQQQQQQQPQRVRSDKPASAPRHSKGKQRPKHEKDAISATPQLSPEELLQMEELRKQEENRLRQLEIEAAEAERIERERREAENALAAKRNAKMELESKICEARDTLKAFVDSISRHNANRASMQPEQLAQARSEFEANKKKLKTDLKRCTAFVKKVKSGAAWSMRPDDIDKDIASLNLSRYVEEVVSAVHESKLKVSDIPVVVALSTAMHRRYASFMQNLIPDMVNVLLIPPKTPDAAKMRRLYMRILVEFLLNGLLSDIKPLVKCIAEASGAKDGNYAVQDANLLVAFCKASGVEIFGILPRSVKEAIELINTEFAKVSAESPSDEAESFHPSFALLDESNAIAAQVHRVLDHRAVDSEVSKVLTEHCIGAYQTLTTSLKQTHNTLIKLQKRCEQDRLMTGSLGDAREKGLVNAEKLRESLLKSVEVMSDVLDQPMPQLEVEAEEVDKEKGSGVEVWTKEGSDSQNDFGPFDDEETRIFYCDIPDFLTTIPPALLGMSSDEIEARKNENVAKYGEGATSILEDADASQEITPRSEAELEADEQKAERTDQENVPNEQLKGMSLGCLLGHADSTMTLTNTIAEENIEKDTPHYKLMVLLEQELPECHRREQLDSIAEKFCTNHGASKNSRKRLVESLLAVPRSRLDLLPYYSRMAAILDRIWPDVATTVVTNLEQQFHGQAKFKKNQNLDSRLKTARYVGSNVEVACSLLETSGRYLYRLKHTNKKLLEMMETMTRLSKAKNLDDRLQSLIKSAFYTVKPPPSGPRKQAKEYSPLETYLRHLLIVRLQPDPPSISFVAKQLARLPWNDRICDCGALVSRLMLKACRTGRYQTIKAVANVAANVRTQKGAGEATNRLIDRVFEELRWALENPNFRDQQRTITYARLLGELHCASQVPGHIILQQLYEFINIGHEIPEALRRASQKFVSQGEGNWQEVEQSSKLPVFNSASGISQTIQEDEEMDEPELDTRVEGPSKQLAPVAVSEYSLFDPRVPSPLDPPNSAYRIKLVCALLEVSGKALVTPSMLPRLKAFVAAFQRYLFTKIMLPAEVEFALLDAFDSLDSQWRRVMTKSKRSGKDTPNESGFPRYPTWIDAHNATVANEEFEAIHEKQKLNRLEILADSSRPITDMESSIAATSLGDEYGSILDEDEESSTSTSQKYSTTELNDFEMEADDTEDVCQSGASDAIDGEDESEYNSEDIEDEEFDENAYMRQMEDEAFERELRRLTMDALEKGKNTSRKLVADHMPSGSQTVKKKAFDGRMIDSSSPPVPMITLGGSTGISFQLLKKGNKGKVESKEILVPTDSSLALVASKQDDEAARERDVIKQRVLRYEAESAQAELTGGNVYLEQEKLQINRNRQLSLEDIDRNFGTTGGNLRPNQTDRTPKSTGRGDMSLSARSARGRGPGRGRSSSGRTLFGR